MIILPVAHPALVVRRLLLVAALVAAAGCVGDQTRTVDPPSGAPEGVVFSAPRDLGVVCEGLRPVECFEPALAVDQDARLFAAAEGRPFVMRSLDGGASWEELAAPTAPPQVPSTWKRGDVALQVDARGRLFYSAIVMDEPVFPQGFVTSPLRGILVARSDDGGASWRVSHYFGPAGTPPEPLPSLDRQWLAFHPDGEIIYLHAWSTTLQRGAVWRSDDGGFSWDLASEAPFRAANGPGAVLADGTLLIPAMEGGASGYEVRVLARADGATSFDVRTVFAGSGAIGYPIVTLAAADDGAVHVAWRAPDGSILVASSADGAASWSEPVRWNEADAADPAPVVVAHGETLDVMWLEARAAGQALVLGRAPLDVVNEGPLTRSVVAELAIGDAPTDLAWFAAREGRVHVVWTDEGGMRFAAETPTAR